MNDTTTPLGLLQVPLSLVALIVWIALVVYAAARGLG